MNEREVKLGKKPRAVCSVTGRPCKCGGSGSCRAWRSSVDNIPNALVSRLRTLELHLDVCKDDADWCLEYDELSRQWPGPEMRDVRRKLQTVQTMVREILGDRTFGDTVYRKKR